MKIVVLALATIPHGAPQCECLQDSGRRRARLHELIRCRGLPETALVGRARRTPMTAHSTRRDFLRTFGACDMTEAGVAGAAVERRRLHDRRAGGAGRTR